MELTLQAAGRILNALKNGVVPDEDLEHIIVGRDKEMQEIQRCFDIVRSGCGVVKFVSGQYGSGKSFLLNAIRQKALQQNFITAKIQIDKGFRFNNLEHFYYHMMHNLSSKGYDRSGTSFENIFDLWVKDLQSFEEKSKVAEEIQRVITELNRYNASFSRAFLTYIRSRIIKDNSLANAVASWLTGEKNIPASVKAKFEVIGNIDRVNSIDFLKAFLKLVQLLGYSGTVILIDELELVMNERSDIRKTSYENIRYIIDICCSGEISGCMFVLAGTDDFFENPEKGARAYQALSQRMGEAIDKSDTALSDIRKPVMSLKAFDRSDMKKLTEKVIDIYSMVYNIKLQITTDSLISWTLLSCKKLGARASELNIREYLTKLLEILDIMEQHPENKVFRAELKTINTRDDGSI
ncbi:MAG: BREX system ATP-binding domain-containing protein [Bacillota bacterium]